MESIFMNVAYSSMGGFYERGLFCFDSSLKCKHVNIACSKLVNWTYNHVSPIKKGFY